MQTTIQCTLGSLIQLCRRKRESSLLVVLFLLQEFREEINNVGCTGEGSLRDTLWALFNPDCQEQLNTSLVSKLRTDLNISPQDDMEMRLARLLSADSKLESLFNFTWSHSLRCSEGHLSPHYQTSTYCGMSQALHSENDKEDETPVTLTSFLNAMSHPEVFTGTNQFFCRACQAMRDSTGIRFIQKASKCLIFCIPRTVYAVETNMWVKRKTPISFPLTLRGPFGEYSLFAFITNNTKSYWSDTVKYCTVKSEGSWWRICNNEHSSILEEELLLELEENTEVSFLFYTYNSFPSLQELSRRFISAEHLKLNPIFSRSVLERSLSDEILESLSF